MEYSYSLTIDAPIEKVVSLFDNKDNLKNWQDGFESYTHLSGEPGKPGAKAMLVYRNGKHEIKLTETILTNDLPTEISGHYEHAHGSNTLANTFKGLPDNKTQYTTKIANPKAKGFMPKLMLAMMSGVYRKHTEKWANQFKKFAEQEHKKPA